MSSKALQSLPISFNSLVIETTSQCNACCDICYQSAGPNGSELIGNKELSKAEVTTVINEASKVEGLSRRLHIAGGEIFLKPKKNIHYFKIAQDTDYFNDIGVTTNAFWAEDKKKAHDLVNKCRKAGLVNMEISWDNWHKSYISADAVSNAIEACANNDIYVILRTLTTKSHLFDEAISQLRPDALALANQITSCPVFPTGRAKEKIDSSDIFHSNISGSCFSLLNLTVNANGDVYPCCSGADQTKGLAMGNIRKESIIDIAARMRSSPMLRTIVFYGVKKLIPILRSYGYKMKGKYANTCHLCFEIFSNDELSSVLINDFDQKVEKALFNAVSSYRETILSRQMVSERRDT